MRDKERRLKKYEAGERVVAADDGDPRLDFFSPFGPLIARATLPVDLIARLNRYVDGVTIARQGAEVLLPSPVVTEGAEASLAQYTARLIRRYLAMSDEDATTAQVEFDVFWVVSQYAGTPSPVHFHSSDISGVLYLKVPEVDVHEEDRTYISGRQAGYINFLIGGKQRFAKSLISFKPTVGEFYIFPGWLLHGAEPFRGAGERRSLAFNANVVSGK